mmetsp:Transcript_27811/g.92454  ORF Transcript_27811/g.92454 Transcript_27811/m.92454 type:complete len:273 (-) Transcript_27811:98-916(-)
MAILSDHGAHCHVAECCQKDFLPFNCDMCKGIFCLDHFRYASHSCTRADGLDNRVLVCPICAKGVKLVQDEDPNLTWDRHMRQGCNPAPGGAPGSKAKCPVPGCKEALTSSGSVSCGRCGLKTCLKHRFEEDHNCAASTAAASLEAAAKARAAAQRPVARPPPAAAAARAAAGARGGEWLCPRCTLLNAQAAAECGACGHARPPQGLREPLSGRLFARCCCCLVSLLRRPNLLGGVVPNVHSRTALLTQRVPLAALPGAGAVALQIEVQAAV